MYNYETENEGDFITNLKFQKTSGNFQVEGCENDSDCSEQYDTDSFFFEPNQVKEIASKA